LKSIIEKIKTRILNGGEITFEESKQLITLDLEDKSTLELLFDAANEIRKKFCGDDFDLCTIMNAKSGRCSENCKYCAQSAHFSTGAEVYPLVNSSQALEMAKGIEKDGAHRFSLVTSGRGIASESELHALIAIYEELREKTSLNLCASHGIISYEEALALKEAGVSTYHHNLESSANFYPEICTSHTFQDRVDTIKNAQKAGLRVCSGGIFGLGESQLDRIEMAFSLKELEVDSIPLNILTPIPGTPLENNEALDPLEILKTIAIYRFINPKISIRYAGGRSLLREYAKKGLSAGINSALTGNYLTTTGSTIESDKKMAREAGFEIR
jgi:biotin synthase